MAINIDDYVMVAQDPGTKNHEDGSGISVSICGKDTKTMREMMLLRGLLLEDKTGMKLTRGPKCSTRVRREYGFKGNHQKLAMQLVQDMIKRGVLAKKENTDED